MKLRTRVVLIIFGIIAFLVLAPLILLAARGYYFDFEHRRLVKTATLALKTEPRGADVFLDGKKTKTTPMVKRFLVPGEYLVEIKKESYQTWKKRITLLPEQALEAGVEGKIFLLLDSPRKEIISTSTPENLENLGFITPTSTDEYNIEEIQQKFSIHIPSFKKSQITVTSARQIFLLLDNDLYLLSEKLNKINSRVAYAYWDEKSELLVYGNANEIWLYRPDVSSPNELVTRSASGFGMPAYNLKTGYIFVSEGNQIKAIETDSKSEPLTFVLAKTENPLARVAVNEEGDFLLYLDGTILARLGIR